jgi:hypothetical protein
VADQPEPGRPSLSHGRNKAREGRELPCSGIWSGQTARR